MELLREAPETTVGWRRAVQEAESALRALAAPEEPRYARAKRRTESRLAALDGYLGERQVLRGAGADDAPAGRALRQLAATLAAAHALLDGELLARSLELARSDYYRAHLRAVRRLGLEPRDTVPLLLEPELIAALETPRGWYSGHLICVSAELSDGYDPTLLHELVHAGQPFIMPMLGRVNARRAVASGEERELLGRELEALVALVEGSAQLLAGLPLDPRQTLPPQSYGGEVEMIRALAQRGGARPKELALRISLSGEALDLVSSELQCERADAAELVLDTAYRLTVALGGLRWDARAERSVSEKAALRRAFASYRRALARGVRSVPGPRPRLEPLSSIPAPGSGGVVRPDLSVERIS